MLNVNTGTLIPWGTPAGVIYMPGFQPFSGSIDTAAEATLIYTFI